MEENTQRRRRKSPPIDFHSTVYLLPFFNGKRRAIMGGHPYGTVWITRAEYFELKELERQGVYKRWELDDVAIEMIKRRERKEFFSSLSVPEQRKSIKSFAEQKSLDIVEQFVEEMIPEKMRSFLSEEELNLKKQELLADLTETMNSKLYWAFYETMMELKKK